MLKYLLFICLFFSLNAKAQTLVQEIELKQTARAVSADEIGNFYVINEDNSLTQFNSKGDSITNFRGIQNGKLAQIDTRNPLKILLFYPEFAKIVILDRMLTLKNEIDLRALQIFQPSSIGMGEDGNIWVYDGLNAQLLKINESTKIINKSEDLRSSIQIFPKVSALMENERKVYLLDKKRGIFVFDQFANYINTIEIKNVQQLQVYKDLLIYTSEDKLFNYNTLNGTSQSINLPKDSNFISARIENNYLLYLFKNKIDIYKL